MESKVHIGNSTQVGRIARRALEEHGIMYGTDEYARLRSKLGRYLVLNHGVGNRLYCIDGIHETISSFFIKENL